jgi:hypothetical protein
LLSGRDPSTFFIDKISKFVAADSSSQIASNHIVYIGKSLHQQQDHRRQDRKTSGKRNFLT